MTRTVTWILLLLILLTAAFLRLTAIDWDEYRHYHPDERYILWVATTIERPSSLLTAFDPTQSTFNPYYWPAERTTEGIIVPQDRPRRFAYGHVPLYMAVLATRLAEQMDPLVELLPENWLLARDILNSANRPEFFHMTAVSRLLTAFFDVGTVLLLFFLGRRLYGTATGLLAAAFLALNVMHIQLAHFFTVDPFVTFFTVAAVLFMVLVVQAQRSDSQLAGPNRGLATLYLLLAAVAIGLAIGSKFGAFLLFLPLAVTVWLDGEQTVWQRGERLLAAVAVAILAFAVTNPFAIIDLTCEVVTPAVRIGALQIPALDWRSCLLENVAMQGGMVRGDSELAFTRQYIGTIPYLYHLEMQLRWGMGPLLGLTAFVGLVWVILLPVYNLRLPMVAFPIGEKKPGIENLVVLAWVIPFFLSTAGLQVKFMRYLQPMIPFLMLYGAAFLLSRPQRIWSRTVIVMILLVTGFYALGFTNLYRQPHPWMAASHWIYANVPPGEMLLVEQWDEPLPTPLQAEHRSQYRQEELSWLVGTRQLDNATKLATNLALLAEADYMILASNRVYGVAPRLPERYPLSSQYHQLLFDGRLGYEVVFVDGRFPNLGDFHLKHDTFGWPGLQPPPAVTTYLHSLPGVNWGRADESFTVYDQPLVIIFANRERLTAAELEEVFAGR